MTEVLNDYIYLPRSIDVCNGNKICLSGALLKFGINNFCLATNTSWGESEGERINVTVCLSLTFFSVIFCNLSNIYSFLDFITSMFYLDLINISDLYAAVYLKEE